jgi:hypothetical protein
LNLSWQTNEPRGAWKILAGYGFSDPNAKLSAQSAAAFFGGNAEFSFWRSILDEVRMYFELNPGED